MTFKAKRILTDFDFTKSNHSVSLVGDEIGGAANGRKILVIKSLGKLPDIDEDIEITKALEQITVSLSMEEFLRKFFNMWSSDAEVLVKLLGFETEHEAYMKDRDPDSNDWAKEHEDWINERMSQFQIMKSLNEGKLEVIKASELNGLVALQQKLEPALIEHFETKEKQMNELEIAKSALTAKDAELATQVELVKSLNDKVAELQEKFDVMKAAEEKAQFEVFAEQLKGLVAEDKFDTVSKGLYQLSKVDAEAAAVTIEAMKSASAGKVAAEKLAADGLTQEQGHTEQVDAEQLQIQKNAAAINAKIQAQAKR